MSWGELGRGAALTGVGLLLVGALAGCSEGSGTQPTPTDAASATAATSTPSVTDEPSSSPTADVPEVPKPVPSDAMRRDDVAGAEAAAVYFTELYPYVYSTGDLTEWKAMSHPECIFCNSVIENVEELVAAGELLRGGEIEILQVESSDPAPGYEFFAVDLGIRQQPTVRVGNGAESTDSPGGETLLKLAVGRVSDQWIVREGESAEYAAAQ